MIYATHQLTRHITRPAAALVLLLAALACAWSSPARASEPAFTAAQESGGGTPGAADAISDIRFGDHVAYERVVVDFGLGNAPATAVPEFSVSSPIGGGYVRISLPDIGSTAFASGDPLSSVVQDFYVVRSPDGGLFVDIFAEEPFHYRVTKLTDPGRLAVDFEKASTGAAAPPAERGEKLVLLQPRPGETAKDPLTVSGYTRTFEGRITASLLDEDGHTLSQTAAKAAGWAGTWGYFETTLEPPPLTGDVTLRVGTNSPRDGSFTGVAVPLSAGTAR